MSKKTVKTVPLSVIQDLKERLENADQQYSDDIRSIIDDFIYEIFPEEDLF